ncbi:MFS transporter [Serratia liquefaciens]|uniref:MFS transporter n=1 Tax=Serratia liquefaciens TaxID=614 RepID=UPI0021796B17|nr:MFS transporter [Serratia liquefaciens]CAI2021801.1 Arabinose efflux permease [Serratia liquefaciens]HEJ7040606.1 MFS transporter [Serratia liquefaciens]
MSNLTETLRNKSLQTIWSAVLISTLGNFLLMLSLSVYVWRITGSNFLASAVFAVQWGAIIFSAPLVSRLLQRIPAARLAAGSEWLGGVVSLAIGLSYQHLWLIFVLLALRGLVESLSKAARVVALKSSVPAPLLGRAASLFGTGTFIGIAVGSLLGAALVEKVSLEWVAFIDSLTFVVSGSLYFLLWLRNRGVESAAPASSGSALRPAFDALRQQPQLRRQFVWVILTTALLQGFHNVARTLLPINLLGLGEEGVMLLQAIASASFFFGALVVALLMQGENQSWRNQPWLIALLSIVLMQFSLLTPVVWLSLTSYAFYLFVFEIAFTFCQKNMIVQCPQSAMAAVSSSALSISTLGMVLAIIVGGALSDRVGLVATGWVFCALFAAVLLWVELPYWLGKNQRSTLEEQAND